MIHRRMTRATGLFPTVVALAMALLAHPVPADPPTFVFTKIADKDTPIPGGTGTFTYIDSPSYNEKMIPTIDGKTVAFVGFGPFSQSGVYAGEGPGDGSSLKMVVNRDTPIPDGSGAFKDFHAVSIAGQFLAFRGTGAAVGQVGIYRKSGGTLTRIADVQTEIPDRMGDLFGGFIDPSVDRDGTVAFRGGFIYLRGLGVYKSVGNTLETVADIETPVPGIPNTLFDSRLTGSQTDYVSIANGVVVFFMESWYGAQPWAGLYAHQGGSIAKAVDYNTQPQGASNAFVPLGMPATDAQGNIVFWGSTSPGGLVEENGIYLHREGALSRIADLQTQIPGTTDTFESFGLMFQTPSVDGDLVVFMGAATTNFADFGIYADVAGELLKVVAPGDMLDGKLVTRLYLGDEAVSDQSIAFLVGLEDGRHAIYRADLLRDPDDDGLFDPDDNCPTAYNPDQENSDGDGQGDACDPDDDNDGIADWADPDPFDPNVGLYVARLADTAAQVNHSWTFVDAASGYLSAVVIAGPPTYHGPDPGVVRLQNISDLGFELRFQEWDYRQRDLADTYHATEEIPYVVLQPGRHLMSDGSDWEVGTFTLGGTGTWQGVSFTQTFADPPHLFLTVQTYNGSQAVSVRASNLAVGGFEAAFFEEEALMDGHVTETVAYLAIDSTAGSGVIDLDGVQVPYLLQSLKADERWSPVLSQRLMVEEEKSRDSEIGHTDETLHVLALGDQFLAQQVSHNGGDTTALRRLAPTNDAPMEWGLIRGIDHSWQTLPFAKTYTDPVLIAKPASNNGADPGVIRLKDLGADHAQLRYQEWSYLNDWHTTEDIFYIVSEAGEHNLGGLTVEADWLTSNKLGRAGQWDGIAFNAVFTAPPLAMPAPVVLASVMTYNGADTVTTRIDNLDLSGFDLAMDEQESKADGHVTETLGWIAIQSGTGTTAEGRKLEVFFEQLDHVLSPVVYTTGHRHLTVLGDVDSTYEADPVSLRYASPTNAKIELMLDEETSADAETDHTLEDVGIFVGE